MARLRLGHRAELGSGRLLAEGPDGDPVVVLREGARSVAIDAMCPHQYAPLIAAPIEDGVIVCAVHGWRFSLETGCDPGNPMICLRRWDVEEDAEGWLWMRDDPSGGHDEP